MENFHFCFNKEHEIKMEIRLKSMKRFHRSSWDVRGCMCAHAGWECALFTWFSKSPVDFSLTRATLPVEQGPFMFSTFWPLCQHESKNKRHKKFYLVVTYQVQFH